MKTLKTPKHKIAPKKTAKKAAPAVILVGTYKERQLAFVENEGVYNYPIGESDKLKPEDAAQVKELWLYAGRTKTARKVFEATFVGIQSKEEFLAAHPTYPKSKSAHTRYLVFETKKLDYGTRLDDQLVFARAADFTTGKSAKIAAAIKAYEADGDYARIADYLPEELAAVPKRQLRVCENRSGLGVLTWTPVLGTTPEYDKVSSLVMSIDAFGRRHSMSAAESYMYLMTNKGLEYLEENHYSLSCLPIEALVEDLGKVCRNNGGRAV